MSGYCKCSVTLPHGAVGWKHLSCYCDLDLTSFLDFLYQEYISYIFGRNIKFGVQMHHGMAECHLPFWVTVTMISFLEISKNLTMTTFGWCAFCLVSPWLIFIVYIGSTDAKAHETVYFNFEQL